MTHVNMMKNFIKVYCRLKQDAKRRKELYKIQKQIDFEEITFHHQVCHKNKPFHRFRFHKIFDVSSTQEELFNSIAKPVVERVLEGYNGTIFAYGQTGSGKTYTITGSPRKYDDRGIIPRAIQEIFAVVNQSRDKFNIKISYLEIYNEIGYDLLNPQYTASCLEELPRVTFLEDGKGEAHLRNLSVQSVYTEQEAMKLLYLGDTNRTIAETPMNEYSSRSHCIFTIYITARIGPENKTRKSKLHLVDLAGSERVFKSNISGVTLNEAKYINLSLHYLEQVILALSQTRRFHIPYRNSMMTLMLKDSLSGNTVTVMLATMATNEKNILETLSTCKFAQRVAMISTEAIVNEESDPQHEIILLKNEIEELKRQIEILTKPKIKSALTPNDKIKCEQLIKSFISSNESVPLNTDIDLGKVEYCFQLLKREIVSKLPDVTSEPSVYSLHDKYQQILIEKDDEISALTVMLRSLQNMQSNATLTKYFPNGIQNLSKAEQEAFDIFLINYQKKDEINFYFNTLDSRYKAAQNEVGSIQNCQKEIMEIRNVLNDISHNNYENKIALSQKLLCLQSLYKSGLANLQMIKRDIDFLKQGLQQTQLKVIQNFKNWYFKDDVKEGGDNIMNKLTLKNSFENGVFFEYQNDISTYKSQSTDESNKLNYVFSTSSLCSDEKVNYPPFRFPIEPHHIPPANKPVPQRQTITINSNYDVFIPRSPSSVLNFPNNKEINPYGLTIAKGIATNLNKENSNTLNLEQNLSSVKYINQCAINKKLGNDTKNYPSAGRTNDLFLVQKHLNVVPNNPYVMNQSSESTSSNLNNLKEEKKFIDFIKSIPLTGDVEVDEEIIQFYRNKFKTSFQM